MDDHMYLYEGKTTTIVKFDYDKYPKMKFDGNLTKFEVAQKLYEMENFPGGSPFHAFMKDRGWIEVNNSEDPNQVVIDALKVYFNDTGRTQKIQTIKLCRLLTKCGLKEAKDFCETYVY